MAPGTERAEGPDARQAKRMRTMGLRQAPDPGASRPDSPFGAQPEVLAAPASQRIEKW